MSTATKDAGQLYSQVQCGRILDLDRNTVRHVADKLGLTFKRDPRRSGLRLDRADIRLIADRLGITPDWEACAGCGN